MSATKANLTINDLPDWFQQPGRRLLVSLILVSLLVVASPFISAVSDVHHYAVAAMYAIGIANILVGELALHNPSNPILPSWFVSFYDALPINYSMAVKAAIAAPKIIILASFALFALAQALLSATRTKVSWTNPAKVLVTAPFKFSPFIPLAPPPLRKV